MQFPTAVALVVLVLQVLFPGVAEACLATGTGASSGAVAVSSTPTPVSSSSSVTPVCTPTRCTDSNVTAADSVNVLTDFDQTDFLLNNQELGSCTCPSQTFTDVVFPAGATVTDELDIGCKSKANFCACSLTGECFTVFGNALAQLDLLGFKVKTLCDPTCNAYLVLICAAALSVTGVQSTTNAANQFTCASQGTQPSSTSNYIKLASISCHGCITPTCSQLQCTGPFTAGTDRFWLTAGQKSFLDSLIAASRQQKDSHGRNAGRRLSFVENEEPQEESEDHHSTPGGKIANDNVHRGHEISEERETHRSSHGESANADRHRQQERGDQEEESDGRQQHGQREPANAKASKRQKSRDDHEENGGHRQHPSSWEPANANATPDEEKPVV